MNSLNLPNPKMMDVAVPANMRVGFAQEAIAQRGWALSAQEAQNLVGRPDVVLVDLRERTERERHGVIPGSLHTPYPDLQAPTSHTRISLTRGVKIAIGLGVALMTAAIVTFFALPAFVDVEETAPSVTLRLVNDTQQSAVVADCLFPDCSIGRRRKRLGPGRTLERLESSDDRVDVFSVRRLGEETCLRVRVHAGYERAGSDPELTLVAKLSQATACPGTPVVPKAVPSRGL
jgi:hypothetical protein